MMPAWRVEDTLVIVYGSWLTRGEIFDSYWLPADNMPDPGKIVESLRRVKGRPDILTFTQRAPDVTPRYDYHREWDNVAAVPVSSYDNWFNDQITPATRRNVKASRKRGLIVRESPFDEAFIRGIMAISNESAVRAGRSYWHYGKDFETVRAEQGTYQNRSSYLGAYIGGELVGYLKLVWDTRTAAIMQIVSKLSALDHRPNNALLSEAVRMCSERGVSYLLYEKFVYGNKTDSSLTRFKRENGFVKMDLPEYHVPLTAKGQIALVLGLHRPLKDRMPQVVASWLLDLRERWLRRRALGMPRSGDPVEAAEVATRGR